MESSRAKNTPDPSIAPTTNLDREQLVHQDTNAMTEVALALAMAFFTVLVLALVSMGVPAVHTSEATCDTEPPTQVATVAVNASSNARDLAAEEILFLYYQGGFYSQDFEPASISNIINNQEVIVAAPPDASLATLLDIQARISGPNLSITTLNQPWMNALEERL